MAEEPLIPDVGDEDRIEVVVVGAGQAGLAIGFLLARQGRRFRILEAADSVGAAWQDRWDSLALFTPRRYDALPGLAFPGDPDGYPTRDEVLSYLRTYAESYHLPVVFDSTVRSLTPVEGGFQLEYRDQRVTADQVVVATGPFQLPFTPRLASQLSPAVFQMHSTGYRQPQDIPAGTVLVVGGGNTGFQIATELSGTHAVHLSVGSRQTPLPQKILQRDLFWWLTKTGLLKTSVDSRLGRRLRERETLIGSSPRQLRRLGVDLHPRAVSAAGNTVTFADDTQLSVDAVVWATGYQPDYSWIEAPVLDAGGQVRHRRGVTDLPGLYFLGLYWQHTRGSALLGWVKDDAEYIATQIQILDDRRKAPPIEDRGNFPSDTHDLPHSQPSELVSLADAEEFDLGIGPIVKRLGDAHVRMLAYNGSVPGPTMRVQQGSEVVVNVTNEADTEATVHWHGLRLENAYDGTHETQTPIQVGESFSYRLQFHDPGLYWYHPHIREDYGQEMGLYGNIVVVPSDPDYWPPVNREELLTLDDVLLEEGQIASFSRTETTYVAMGRFGNTMLIGGDVAAELSADLGEVVRFYFTNTANTRVFNVGFDKARMKLVGGDSGRFEHESFVQEVMLAPSERIVVDVLFDQPGLVTLEHRHPERTYPLASVTVGEAAAEPQLRQQFEALRTNADMTAERHRLDRYRALAPDKTLAFVAEMDMGTPEGPIIYSCPMHPEVVSEDEGTCPSCGMKLLAISATTYTCPMHLAVVSDSPDRCPECGMKLMPSQLVNQTQHDDTHEKHHGHSGGHSHEAAGGIEWEDDMVDINRITTPANMRWKLVDRSTGEENHAIDWHFKVGDQVKVRLVNEMDSDHPMHHPFHIHGAGRFLVMSRDDTVEPNLVWKDTVLVRTGETVDILLDVTNAGLWMAHCHIAEHHESGMMFSFNVDS